jgi:hypothetical protein
VFVGLLAAAGFYYFYFDRNDLPDLDGFTRFEFTTIGHIYDANGQPLKEMASEARQITRYEEIPPICPRRHRRRRRQELLLPFRNSGTMKSASFQRDQVARTIVQIMACAGATD